MIYVLELLDGNYYVGYSSDDKIENRINKHFKGQGSMWTKKYQPISVIKIIDGDKITERDITIEYMKKYGFNKVRGAGWTAVNLNNYSNMSRIII